MTYSFLFLLCLNVKGVQWMSAYESFNDFSYTDSSGWYRSTGTYDLAPIANCPRNGMSFTYLDKNYLEISKSITNIAPHYQIRMVAEIYYSGSLNDEFGKVYFNNALIMSKIYDYQGNMTFYQNLCGLDFSTLNIYTANIAINPHTASSVVIKIQTDVDSPYTNEAILVRNVQVFILKCHVSCKTCNNPDYYNCLSCFLGAPSGGQCKYCSDATGNINLQFTDIIYGCVQECSRTNYIAIENKLCQYDQSTYFQYILDIYPKFTYYDTTSFSSIQFDLIIDPIFTLTISPRIYTFTCNSQSVAGPYFYNEGIQKILTLPSGTQKIRFRATFYLLGTWDEQAQIQTKINNVSFGQLYYEGGVYKSRNSNIIYSGYSGNCNSMAYEIIRIEQIILLTTNNIVLQIVGSNNVNTIQGWAVRDIFIDVKVCSLNCDICDDTENCLTCSSTFLLYKGQCVSVCPPHGYISGIDCRDYDQETLHTSYLIKEFYDLSTSDYVAQNIFDLITQSGTNFFKGVYYSYIPKVRVFGGSLTWLKAKFSKTFPVTAKHYSKRVRFLVIFGDNFGTGQFKYQINSGSVVTLTRTGQPNSQIWGDTGNEYFYQVNVPVNDASASIFLSVECVGPAVQINEAFCAIQNLFITINECPTFCDVCDNTGICTSWLTVSNFNTGTQLCDDGYYLDSSIPSCEQCVDTGCLKCSSSTICTLCESSFILSQGQCQCKIGNYLTTGLVCDVCNDICEQCFEADDQSCLSCNIQQNRYLNKHQCICLNHYQQIFDDLVCQPICGDLFVVGDEECDDGNDIQFDGCHQCKYSCQLECKQCAKGLCEECHLGYYLNSQLKKCQPTCNNQLVSGIEQCDDSSYLSGCVNCQYQCQSQCTLCIYGLCHECNIPGWKLHYNNLCQTTCGDGIVVGLEECDDANILPFDGCHACQYSCVEGCSNCYKGKCLFCAKGWQYISATNQCLPLDNNGLIEGNQVCDDFNQYFGDGCYLGEFSCAENCEVCEYGECITCKIGYYLQNTIGLTCQSRCGDLLKSDDEECDDLNQNCNNCQLQCNDGCATCLNGDCFKCKQYWILNDVEFICNPICGDQHLVAIYEQCDDGNLIDYDGCSSTCEFQCQNECTNCKYGICLDCAFNWILDNDNCYQLIENECEIYCTNCINGICIKCNEEQGYYLQTLSGKCNPLCGDNLLTIYEECDDGNIIDYDGCSNQCFYQCSLFCDKCEYGICQSCIQGYILIDGICDSICGDNQLVITEQCDDGNMILFDGCSQCQFQCEINCAQCYQGICYVCNVGFSLNTITSECMPICGDGQIVGFEICDDQNNIPFDGCFECQFQCEQPCTLCLYGVCYECNTLGYEIIDNHCHPICGDSLVLGDEECDDGNLIPYDGCFECHFQCQQPCLICNEQLCYKCELGWILIDYQCEPLCGDQIILPEYEDCDDGNMIPYDGCYDCSYQCQLECTDCRLGICYECNTTGWEIQISSYRCHPICGDGLVIDIEECDDPDNLGCQECKFVCHEKCQNCISGICYQCDNGWYPDGSQCFTICGDGYKTEQEECDDYNLYDLDGCSINCKIEPQWMCETHNYQSYCVFKVDPQFQLEYLENETNNQQNVTIGFTNGMRKYCEFEFNIDIEGCEMNSYTISINPIVEANYNKLLRIQYEVQIDFSQNCIRPKVVISLNNNECLMNYYAQQLNPPHDYIILNQINIISDEDRSRVSQVSIMNDIILYSFLALFTLSIITGGLDLMWNMLDLLQYLSYLQFINVPFPRNLDIYFEVFGLVSIQPVLELIQLDSLINLFQGDSDLPFVQCQYKFKELNGLFLYNIESLIFVLLSSYCLHFIQKVIFMQLRKVTFKYIMNLGLKYANYFLFVRKLLFQSIITFFTSQQLRILMSNAYDINFSLFIQMIHFDTSTTFLGVNSVFSLLGLLVYFIIVFKLFQYKGLNYSPLIEGIQNTSHWGKEYNCVQLMKKMMFILFLVLLQTVPIYQSLFISCLCLSNLCYILVAKPFINCYEYYKVILSEGVVFICSLTFILYEINVNYSEIYSDEIYQALGWIHIAIISSLLCISLIIDAKQQVQILIVKFKKYQNNHQHELNSVKPNVIMFY